MGTLDFFLTILIPKLNSGLILSLAIILPSASIGLVLGLLTGAGRAIGPLWLKKLLGGYVAIFRGTPLVVQLMIWFYGLPSISTFLEELPQGSIPSFLPNIFRLSPYAASIIAFSACSGAYHSEYIRGAILSIKKGQFQAARALGFSPTKIFWAITAPVAIRRALPGCGNEIIYLIKYSSLAFIVTITEMTGQAKGVASIYFRHTECYFLAGLYYLILVSLATWLLRKTEQYLAIPGLETESRDK